MAESQATCNIKVYQGDIKGLQGVSMIPKKTRYYHGRAHFVSAGAAALRSVEKHLRRSLFPGRLHSHRERSAS
jgi:hypothetical protein